MTRHISIIGGGFCGIMTTIQLARHAKEPLKISVVNSGHVFGKGIAYSAYSATHLLNVTAGNMSAFPDKPTDFLDWAHKKEGYLHIDSTLLSRTFLPRVLYGEYIEHTWAEFMNTKPASVEIDIIHDTAVDVEVGENNAVILLKSGKQLAADKLVLATGNSEPRNPSIPNTTFYSSPDYFKNSWQRQSVENVKDKKAVLIIGGGLTMVDTVLGLLEHGFTGRIYSLSPHGFAILPHRHGGVEYKGLKDELKEPYVLENLVRLTHKHIRIVRKLGLSAEPIIDSLRPYTQKIWQSLSLKEKRYFMSSKLRHLWGVARHRLPVHIHDKMQHLRIDNKLEILAGNVLNITETPDEIKVDFHNCRTHKNEALIVDRVINCTGPESSLKRTENLVLHNMWKRGILTTDPLELGINADAISFKVIDKYGDKVSNLFTLGTNLRGMLWESTAVPELRVQAESLAKKLLQN